MSCLGLFVVVLLAMAYGLHAQLVSCPSRAGTLTSESFLLQLWPSSGAPTPFVSECGVLVRGVT